MKKIFPLTTTIVVLLAVVITASVAPSIETTRENLLSNIFYSF